VTGTVFGDGQPLANTTVHLGSAIGVLPPLTTDVSGRYRVEILNGTGVFLWVSDDRFRLQPCAAWVETAGYGPLERTADLHLASAAGALSAGSQIVPGRRRVSGTVHAMTASGPEPVSGVSVALVGSNDDWNAWTSTDTAGRFSLCGLPIDQRLFIYSETHFESEQSFRWASRHVEPGGADANLELILQ
jgi:hypothetical protein